MRWLMLVGLFALGGCATAPEWQSVSVDSFGKGGSAHKTVNADGSMTGGHLSGDVPPRFYRDSGRMAEADVEKLEALLARLPAGDGKPRPAAGSTISITAKDGATHTFAAASGERFGNEDVSELYGLVARQRVGGW